MPRRRRPPTAALACSVSPSTAIPVWLFVALAAPRLVRMLFPEIWVEDDLYLESALATARGLRPYLDFTHPQGPLLEWLAGAYLSATAPSHRAMELLNGGAIYVTSVLIVVVGQRTVGRP